MIDVRRLQILRELARCGTIAATAEAVHLTPSAVSQQLAALSKEAGTAMLEPDGRRVRLTTAAELLLAHAHEIFAHLEHAEADLASFRRGQAGTVRLGGFPTSIRGIAVPALRMVAARSGIQVLVVQVGPEDAEDALLARTVDVAITLIPPGSTVDGSDARFEAEHLFDENIDIVLPDDHPLADRAEVALADLADEDWIGLPGGFCWTITMAACAAAGFTPRSVHSVDEDSAVLGLVAAHAGVATIPRLARSRCQTDPVVVRPVADGTLTRRIALRYRAGTAAQPHIAPLLAVLRELGSQPDLLMSDRDAVAARTA